MNEYELNQEHHRQEIRLTRARRLEAIAAAAMRIAFGVAAVLAAVKL